MESPESHQQSKTGYNLKQGSFSNLGDYVVASLLLAIKAIKGREFSGGYVQPLQPNISDLTEKTSFYFMCSVISTMALVDLCFKFVFSFSKKPAEEFVDFIAKAFLIEWSSDLATIVPDQLENLISRLYIF